jgi:Domain of unknown function (DUF4349)
MNRVLILLLALGLLGSGCAVSSKSSGRPSYPGGGRTASESDHATISTSGGAPAPASVSRSYRRSSRTRYRRGHRTVAKAKAVSGHKSPAGATPAVTKVARGTQIPRARMVIYRGTLVLRIFKRRDAVDLAQKLALETGAYIQTQNNSQLVIRVGVQRFHELMAKLSAVGEVASKSIAAQDVTRQFFDITHRLKAAHVVLARLQSLLLKAKNVNESLQIEREMGRLLTRIERHKGMLRYLKHHASLSTIVVHFRVKPRYTRRIRSSWRSPFGWVKGLGLWRMMRF